MIHGTRFIRSLFGLIIGSVAASVSYLILPMLWSSYAREYPQFSLISACLGTFAILIFAVPCGFLAHALLYALKWRALLVYCIAAAFEAGLYSVIVGYQYISIPNWDIMFAAIPSAIVCATVAWLIRRPDKDVKPLP